MAASMETHRARPPLYQLDDNRPVDVPITRRLPPVHAQESPKNAYSNLMPITSLVHSPQRGEIRTSSFDTLDHRSDSKTSQQSDDSFSVYVEHRVRESTPQQNAQQQLGHAVDGDSSQSYSQARHSHSSKSRSIEVAEPYLDNDDEEDRSWPTVIDHEREDEVSSNQSQLSLRPDDSQEQYDEDEMECDVDMAGKKKRRRTNKAEANVLASVFSQTQFPDAHTREALAKRLNMKPKAVSIWFQNRRQAMKKRASRFGGVEGVNGPTVTAATMQVLDVEQARQGTNETKELDLERLQTWMTLDDLAAASDEGDQSKTYRPEQTTEGAQSDRKEEAGVTFSSAPILDLICQQRGHQQLSRMASMPSLASIMSAKGSTAKSAGLHKDMRDLLPLKGIRLSLNRASSASALPALQIHEEIATQGHSDTHSELSQSTLITSVVESKPSLKAGSQCSMVGGKVAFPAMLARVLQSRGLEVPKQGSNIWQRMQSSSSSSDGVMSSPDSNKENLDPNATRTRRAEDADEDEDEEKTLRMIAGRRAAKESAKKERKLSEMGKKYVEEADARVALQQKKRPSFGGHSTVQALGKGPAPASAYSAQRGLVRAASDAHAFRGSKNPMVLVRVPSLELTAGRDRAKDDDTSHSQNMMDLRLAKRPPPFEQDENVDTNIHRHRVKRAGKPSQQSTRPLAHSRMPLQSVKNVPARSGEATSRPFAPSRSLPNSTATLSMSRLETHPARHLLGTNGSRFEGARESSARFDGQEWHSVSSSQEDSENGSDEWLEAWTLDKRRLPANAGVLRERNAAVLNSESAHQERKRSGQMTHPTPRHDDSGFYGSESGLEDDCDGDGFVERRTSKRRLLSQNNSSSPLKRGDERDRLAAETLLGLGSRA